MVEVEALISIFTYLIKASSLLLKDPNDTELSNIQFWQSSDFVEQLADVVAYQPDKDFADEINSKYQHYLHILEHFNTIDYRTKAKFVEEILYGNHPLRYSIQQFHNNVYAPGGYCDEKSKRIVKGKEDAWFDFFLTPKSVRIEKRWKNIKKLFSTLTKTEEKAFILILFAYRLEQSFEGKHLFHAEILIEKKKNKKRLGQIKAKLDYAINRLSAYFD